MRTLLAGLILAVGMSVVATVSLQAQDKYDCIIINGVKCRILYDDDNNPIDTLCDDGTTGSGSFTTTNETTIPAQGAVDAELTPSSVTSTVRDATLGSITTSLDASRTASNTTIKSVTKDRFPLDVRIRFFAQAEVESKPGEVFLSRTELEFGDDNVNSVAPFEDVKLALTSDVEFYSKDDKEQKTVFTLRANESSVTLSGDKAPEGDGGLE